jgi:hypothetical protein
MASPIIDGTNIDTSVFSYSAPKANPSGGKVVNLYNKHFRESLTISTPIMLTWGAQEGMDQAKNPTGKFTLALQFPSGDFSNPDAENFLNSMRALEAKVKADAMTNSKEWFGKEIKSADVMDEKFNVMLRHPKKEKGSAEMDYTKAPTLTIKIPCWKGVWQTEIYDEEGGTPLFLKSNKNSSVTPLDFLKPKTHLMCLIQCGGLWFVNGKVSITWNLKQAVVQKPKTSAIVEGVCFLKPKPADVQRLKSLPPPENDNIDPEGPVVSTIVEDSDDEYELPAPPTKVAEPVVEKVVEQVVPPVVEQVSEEVVAAAAAPVETKKKLLKKKGT